MNEYLPAFCESNYRFRRLGAPRPAGLVLVILSVSQITGSVIYNRVYVSPDLGGLEGNIPQILEARKKSSQIFGRGFYLTAAEGGRNWRK